MIRKTTKIWLLLVVWSIASCNNPPAEEKAVNAPETPAIAQEETFRTIEQEKVDAVNMAIAAGNLSGDFEIMSAYAPRSTETEGNYTYTITAHSDDADHKTLTLVEEGLLDDSMAGRKVVMSLAMAEGNWKVAAIKENYRCYPGRGHEGWSAELCN